MKRMKLKNTTKKRIGKTFIYIIIIYMVMKELYSILENLVELAYIESEKAVEKKYFTKDFAEACGIVLSLAYGRWNEDDK